MWPPMWPSVALSIGSSCRSDRRHRDTWKNLHDPCDSSTSVEFEDILQHYGKSATVSRVGYVKSLNWVHCNVGAELSRYRPADCAMHGPRTHCLSYSFQHDMHGGLFCNFLCFRKHSIDLLGPLHIGYSYPVSHLDQFLKMKVSQGNVLTRLRCGDICNRHFIAKLLLSPLVKEKFWKSVNIWWSFRQE